MKIGDVVAWVDAPSGAMVAHGNTLFMRVGGQGWCVGTAWQSTCMFGHYSDGEACEPWRWEPEDKMLTILALGLTGSETKETLSMLVRHFEESAATLNGGA